MASISPDMTSSVTSSVTTRLPKLFCSPRRDSTGSGMTEPLPKARAEADQPAAREQDHQHEQRPENHLPIFGYSRQPCLGEEIDGSADDGAVERADAAEDHHDDQLAGLLPGHVGRRDELGRIRQ